MNQLIHTPEGVRDIYGREYAERLNVRRRIRNTFHRYGYQDVQTPSFEFYDIFSADKGSADSREMFKFFDRDGEMLVLRPDMTPAVARCAVKYFEEEKMPLRLSYIENTFINRTSYQGRLKEFTQAGAEYLGDPSPDADAEILALTIECLTAAGLREFQLEVGHVGFLRGLLRQASLPAEKEEEIRDLLENKNTFGLEEVIRSSGISEDLRRVFLRLPELSGDIEHISSEADCVSNQEAWQAVERLREIYDILRCYGLEKYVSFDLGMVGRYRYYNGMIFKGYTYGSGEPAVTGGRYDNLMEQFGRQSGAVGFAIVLDSVMSALSRQNIHIDYEKTQTMIVYTLNQREQAIAQAGRLRQSGCDVLLQRTDISGDETESRDMFRVCRQYAAEQEVASVYCLDEMGRLEEVPICDT